MTFFVYGNEKNLSFFISRRCQIKSICATMSKPWPRRGAVQETVTLRNARVFQIRRVEHPVLVSLVHEQHNKHFPADCVPKKMMPVADAKKKWNSDPRFLKQSNSGSSVGGEGEDNNGVLETDMPDVEDFIGEVDASARETHSADKHDMLKRHEAALEMRGEAIVRCVGAGGQGETFYYVSGEWCTLSTTVPLRICGTMGGKTKFRGIDIQCITAYAKREQKTGIWPDAIDTVSAADFEAMLSENGQFAGPVRRRFIIELFKDDAASTTAPAQLLLPPPPPQSTAQFSLNRPSALHTALEVGGEERERAYQTALSQQLRHSVLLARICSLQLSPTKMLRAPMPELALRLTMLNQYLTFVAEYYNGDFKIAMSLVARGESPPLPATIAVGSIPRMGRAIDDLCQHECLAIVYHMMLYEPHILCFRPLRKRIGEERRQPWLVLLPDLTLESYRRLVAPGIHQGATTPPAHISIAVDIYHSIVMRDIKDHGHMFTVFGISERDLADSYYHRRGFEETPETLRAVDTLGQHGSFVLPPATRRLTMKERTLLAGDRARLACGSESASSDEFAEALRWLVDEKVVTREQHTGTGRHNFGQPFDLFQSVNLHEDQQALVKILVDIYRRGREQASLVGDPGRLLLPVEERLYAHFSDLARVRALWARDYIPAVIESREKRALLKLLALGTAVPPADAVASSSEGALLRNLAVEIAKYDAAARERYLAIVSSQDDQRDAYTDARANRHHRVPSLMLGSRPPHQLENGRPLAAEQIAAIEHVICDAIAQPVGRGGVGKSELARYIGKCYESQIVMTGFTGNSVSELTRRTGIKAHTIHALLFRHTRFREATIRSNAYRRYAAKKNAMRAGDGSRTRKTADRFTLDDVRACTDDYDLRTFVEEHIGGIPPFLSPFPLGGCILVIDEMSLVPFTLFYSLLRAAHCPEQGRFIAKLVLMGDLDQLPPIEFGNVQSDISHGFATSVYELVQNHRSDGTQLFDLAQAIAEHRAQLPIPKFDIVSAADALVDPNQPIVAFRCGEGDAKMRIDYVYDKLGAFHAGAASTIDSIQTIATTNPEVDSANETIRNGLFGNRAGNRLAPATAVQMIGGGGSLEEELDAERAQRRIDEAREQLARRVMVGDRIFFTRNQRFLYAPTERDPEQREKLFYNSRFLTVEQFYNAPARIMPTTWCRCQLCPPKNERMPPNYVSPCLRRRDDVPERRRGPDVSDPSPLRYHSENMQFLGTETCRMAVFRDQSGQFIECNAMKMLGTGLVPSPSGGFTPYARGFAVTVHRMQGAQQRRIVYLCSKQSKNVGWRAVYTALTRAQTRVIILSTEERFLEFVYKLEPIRRSSLWFALSKALDNTLNLPSDRSITERWNEFEARRYRTDCPAVAPATSIALSAPVVPPVILPKQEPEDDDADDDGSDMRKRACNQRLDDE
jgi:hypothetical protein